jgi:hypothetical protein
MRGDCVNIGEPQLVQNQGCTTSPVDVSQSSYCFNSLAPAVHVNFLISVSPLRHYCAEFSVMITSSRNHALAVYVEPQFLRQFVQ